MKTIAELILGLYREWGDTTLLILSTLFILISIGLLIFGGNWRKRFSVKTISIIGFIIFLISFLAIAGIFLTTENISRMDTGGLIFAVILMLGIPINLLSFILSLLYKDEIGSLWSKFTITIGVLYVLLFIILFGLAIPIEINYQKEFRYQHTISKEQAIGIAENRINDSVHLGSCVADRHDKFDGQKTTDYDTWEVRCEMTDETKPGIQNAAGLSIPWTYTRTIWLKSTDGSIISDRIPVYPEYD